MKRFTPPLTTKIDDADTDAMRRNIDQRIAEVLALPAIGATVLQGIAMPADGHVFVKHGLGRAPLAVWVSPPRNTAGLTVGLISEARGSIGGVPIDSTQVIVLVAGAFTNAFTVDAVVW